MARPDAAVDGGSNDAALGDGAPPDGTDTQDGVPAFRDHLATTADFASLTGEGWAVKYLGAVEGRTAPAGLERPCTFQNTARYPLHLQFLHTFPSLRNIDFAAYLALTTKSATRVLWAGELQSIPGGIHPGTGKPGILAFFVYGDAAEDIAVDDLIAVHRRLQGCAPFARELLVLVAADPEQARDFEAKRAALEGAGVAVADLSQLRPVVGAEGYSLGEGYGYLRVIPRGQRSGDLGPRDIVVTEGSFEDIGLVAGLITAQAQSLHSHVNLRLREKQIPNARVPNIYENQAVQLLDGKLAHLVVTGSEARLAGATVAHAEAFWASRRPVARPLSADLNETRLGDFTTLRGSESPAYGAKAANLGELFRLLPTANRVPGFAVPFSAYRAFAQETGVEGAVATFLADARVGTDAGYRRATLRDIRNQIEAAPLSPAFLDRLRAAARTAFGSGYVTQPTRFRSSSNAEDGETTSGAGLYDSFRGCFADDDDGDDLGPSRCLSDAERAHLQTELERREREQAAFPQRTWLGAIIDDLRGDLGKERPVARAVRKVYASLWNERAFEERAFYGMDHTRAFMGIAVNPSFVRERVDAVAVTNLPIAGAPPLTRLVSQSNGQPVVRPPDPTLVAEVLTFRRGAGDTPIDVRIVTPSSQSPAPLWRSDQLATLSQLLAKVQDHFAAEVYPQIPSLSLDFEIKITDDDRVVIKQARPYPRATPSPP
ncbi:MAG TPA: PEP/pyruvate-binding domain-containing protein [Polyangia bacterium]